MSKLTQYLALIGPIAIASVTPADADGPEVKFFCDNGKRLVVNLNTPQGAVIVYDGKTLKMPRKSGGPDGLTFAAGKDPLWTKETDAILTLAGTTIQCVEE